MRRQERELLPRPSSYVIDTDTDNRKTFRILNFSTLLFFSGAAGSREEPEKVDYNLPSTCVNFSSCGDPLMMFPFFPGFVSSYARHKIKNKLSAQLWPC